MERKIQSRKRRQLDSTTKIPTHKIPTQISTQSPTQSSTHILAREYTVADCYESCYDLDQTNSINPTNSINNGLSLAQTYDCFERCNGVGVGYELFDDDDNYNYDNSDYYDYGFDDFGVGLLE